MMKIGFRHIRHLGGDRAAFGRRLILLGCCLMFRGLALAAASELHSCAELFQNPWELAKKSSLTDLAMGYARQTEKFEQFRSVLTEEERQMVARRHHNYYRTYIQEIASRLQAMYLDGEARPIPWQVDLFTNPGLAAVVGENNSVRITLKAGELTNAELWENLTERDREGHENSLFSMTMLAKPLTTYWQKVGMPAEVTLELLFYDGRLGGAPAGSPAASFILPREVQRNQAYIVLPSNFFYNHFDSGLRLIHELAHYKNLALRPALVAADAENYPVTMRQPKFFSFDEADAYLVEQEFLQKFVRCFSNLADDEPWTRGIQQRWGNAEIFRPELLFHLQDWQRVVAQILNDLKRNLTAVQQALAASGDDPQNYQIRLESLGKMVRAMAQAQEGRRLKVLFSFNRPESDHHSTPLTLRAYIYDPETTLWADSRPDASSWPADTVHAQRVVAIKAKLEEMLQAEEQAVQRLEAAYLTSLSIGQPLIR